MAGEDDLPPESSANVPALRLQGSQFAVIRPGSGLISRIAGDAYGHLPSPSEKLWRVGDYEVNEQSYRQILIWLDQIKADGQEITVEDFVGLQDEYWVSNYWVEKAYFCPNYGFSADFILPHNRDADLDNFDFVELWLSQINLSLSPNLKEIRCDFCQLNALDLSRVPKLKRLSCLDNLLTELDLSQVPLLTELSCGHNQIMQLDLSHVPCLETLRCDNNQISEIDLSNAPRIKKLICGENKIAYLDLSHVPKLMALECRDSQIKELDIRVCVTSKFRLLCDSSVVVNHRPDRMVVRTSSQ